MSSNALFSFASAPKTISLKATLFFPAKTFEMLASSALKIGRPTIEGKTEVGKLAFENPHLTNYPKLI